MEFLELLKKTDRLSPPAPSFKTCLRVERLETRVVPYSVSGNAWPNPQLITISFVPDGTFMTTINNAKVYSNLFATFNAKWAPTTWQNEILQAAQLWAQQANINFAVVSDSGTAAGGGNYQQGDPGMGDIRIGGYNFGSTSYLGGAYQPPSANNYSIAGDFDFNTKQSFNIGTTYDIQSVALHELGHALGLSHSSTSGAVMYPSYSTVKRALTSDDTAGIQAIYGPRKPDTYNSNGNSNGSFQTAADISSQIDANALTAVVNNLDLTSTSGVEYFTFQAPANTSGTFTVNVQSSGLSLLRPAETVYAADRATILGSAVGTGDTGSTLSVTVTGVNPGDQFYVAVSGADTTQFATGNFALSLNLGSGAMPTVSFPNTQLANGSVHHGGGGTYARILGTSQTSTDQTSTKTKNQQPVMDYLAISDQFIPLACRMHGAGCGCPACAGVARMTTPAAAEPPLIVPGWLLSGGDDSYGPSASSDSPNSSTGTSVVGVRDRDALFAEFNASLVTSDPTAKSDFSPDSSGC